MNHPPSSVHRAQGFTLIELLVVIAIIGALAAILIPSYAASQKRPYDVAALQCGRAIAAAQITYEAEHNHTAANGTDQLNNGDVSEQCQNVQVAEDWQKITDNAKSGTNHFGYAGPNYAFDVWSQNGSSVYFYYYPSADSHFVKTN